MKNIEKVNDFLKKAGTFYLSTVDGDKPKCRPISFSMVVDDKLYFGVGTHKEVYRQLISNANTEICACTGEEFLRYYGKAVMDPNPTLIQKAIEVLPMLKDIYNEQTGLTLGIFSLSDATAEFRDMIKMQEKIEFNE